MFSHSLSKAKPFVVGSVFLAAVVACALCAAALTPAHANAAGNKTMWVVASKTVKNISDEMTTVVKYSYNKGAITSQKTVEKYGSDKWTHLYTYKYDKKFRITSESEKNNGKPIAGKIRITHNKKGYLVKHVFTPKGSNAKYVSEYSYDSKGRLTKDTATFGSATYFYDSRGNVKTKKEDSAETGRSTIKYSYDAKGNLTKQQDSYNLATYTNTYEGSRLVKRVGYDENGKKASVTTYKYKKVTAPKAASKLVKSQQKWIVNEILPFYSAHC